MATDCCFVSENSRFRFRVAALIIEDGCVLLACNSKATYFYTIGGGVHLGETSQQAVEREVMEEIGVPYKVDRLVAVHENFFHDTSASVLNKYDSHEVAFVYLMKSRGTKQLPEHQSFCIDGREYARWIAISDLPNHTHFPVFLQDLATNLPNAVQHFVTKQ